MNVSITNEGEAGCNPIRVTTIQHDGARDHFELAHGEDWSTDIEPGTTIKLTEVLPQPDVPDEEGAHQIGAQGFDASAEA